MDQVEWLRDHERTDFTTLVGNWEQLPRRAQLSGLRKKPDIGRGPFAAHFHNVLLQRVAEGFSTDDVVFFARDVEGNEANREDLERVLEIGWAFRLVAMLPDPEVEVWQIVLAELPEQVVAEVTARLGFSPVDEPLRLSATTNSAGRDCKVVRDLLGLPDWNDDDWSQVSAARLDSVAGRTTAHSDVGLRGFLGDVKSQLIGQLARPAKR
ncbi:MAG: hypothetical protein JNJ54_25215 [Myxococcaceae bacterium]|nr:hypothetical protein [Myxococcaceae bacterium]